MNEARIEAFPPLAGLSSLKKRKPQASALGEASFPQLQK